ncbi:MAG: protein kinase [Phycisphaerales bacterium]|nr:protein kinase [Phycisphaerales bacterium]
MSDASPDKLRSDRIARVQDVVRDTMQRRARGERLPDDVVIAAHRELMPELGAALASLAVEATQALPLAGGKAPATRPAAGAASGEGGSSAINFGGRSAAHGARAADASRCGGADASSGSAADASGSSAAPADMTIALGPRHQTTRSSPSASESSVPPEVRALIPGYEILQEISRGGQGVVYLGIEQAAKRRVAIKLLLSGASASDVMRRRFEREIELVAQLKHPNIISIYHSGETCDGRQFYVMDYVEGVPLDRYVRDRQLGLEPTLSLLIDVCEGIQYAHQRGMIHRDLKPGNILVEEAAGDVGTSRIGAAGTSRIGAAASAPQASMSGMPVPRILDFGLAKLVDAPADRMVSISQEVVGTLPFMSPEQATGRQDEVDTRTDVYALGVMMYCLLTGEYPYTVVGSLLEVVQNITDTAPMPPIKKWHASPNGLRRKMSRQCPFDEDVQTIVLKALAKEPDRRYQSAGDLARDLRRYLAGAAIEARADSGWYVFRKTVRRYRFGLGVAAAFMLLIAGSAVALWFMYRQQGVLLTEVKTQKERAFESQNAAEVAGEKEKTARGIADERAIEAQRQAYLASIGAADAALRAGDVLAASRRLELSAEPLRGWEWRHLMTLVDRSTATLAGANAAAHDVTFTSEESLAAAAYADGSIVVTDMRTRTPRSTYKAHDGEATCVGFSPDRKLLASGGLDGLVVLRDTASGDVLKTLKGHTSGVTRLAFHPDGALLVSASRDGTLRLWTIPDGAEAGTFSGHEGWVTSLDFSSNGQRVLSGGMDGRVNVWDIATKKAVLAFSGHAQAVNALAVSRFGDLAASASWGMIKVWNLSTGREQTTLRIDGGDVGAVAISPDGTRVAAGSADGGLRLYDATTGFEISVLRGHVDRVLAVTFSPEFSWIATASADRTVKLWDAGSAEQGSMPVHAAGAGAAAVSEDGRLIALALPPRGKGEGPVALYNAHSGKVLCEFNAHAGSLSALAFSADGATLATGASDRRIKLWDVPRLCEDGEKGKSDAAPRATFDLAGSPMCMTFSPARTVLAAGLENGDAVLCNVGGGGESGAPRVMKGHSDAVASLSFNADGTLLATGSWDGSVRLWTVADAHLRAELEPTGGSSGAGAPNGAGAASGTVTTSQPGRTDGGGAASRSVLSVAIGPDGASVLAGGRSGRITRWDMASQRSELLAVIGMADVIALKFTPDDGRLAAGLQSGAVCLLDPRTGEALLTLRGHEKPLVDMTFVQGGTRLLTTSSDGVVRTWEAPR